jgi:ABC-type transporter Mla subunit MlaD
MGTSNRIELEREWKDATDIADHLVDVIQDLERQIQQAGTLQSRLVKAKEEFREANQKVIKLSNELAQL